MNTYRHWLSHLKQEIIPLTYLSFANIWWSFNSPVLTGLGVPLDTIMSVIVSILSVTLCFSIFLSPAKYASFFTITFLDDTPDPDRWKKNYLIWVLIVLAFSLSLCWYYNLYNMSFTYYALCYGHGCVTYLLILQRIEKYNQQGW